MKENYEFFIRNWIKGIRSELQYWEQYIVTKGYGETEEFYRYTASERPFILENDIWLRETDFIDIGSGPFSLCGTKTTRTDLHFQAVDMLAPIYRAIKQHYGLITEVNPEFAIMECLSEQFGYECFDIVHISNALDHTFDPMTTIEQLLAICRIGGKVILQHHQNEAEAAKYDGLHQWNCTLQNGKFEIWNKELRIDVAENLGDSVEIYLERHAPMDKVVLTKKKAYIPHNNPYRYLFEAAIVQELQRRITEEYFRSN